MVLGVLEVTLAVAILLGRRASWAVMWETPNRLVGLETAVPKANRQVWDSFTHVGCEARDGVLKDNHSPQMLSAVCRE